MTYRIEAATREEWAERAIAAERERDGWKSVALANQETSQSHCERWATAEARLAAIRAILARYERHRCRIVTELKEVMGDE